MHVPDDLPPHPAGNAWEAQVKMPLLVMTRELEVVVREEMIQQDGPRKWAFEEAPVGFSASSGLHAQRLCTL